MSTKSIREIVERARRHGWAGADEALAEAEAIERAARTVAIQGIYLEEEHDDETESAVDEAETVLERIAHQGSVK
jgi:hypothetical protein